MSDKNYLGVCLCCPQIFLSCQSDIFCVLFSFLSDKFSSVGNILPCFIIFVGDGSIVLSDISCILLSFLSTQLAADTSGYAGHI